MPIDRDLVVKTLMQQRAELIGFAWSIVGDANTAEDVFQEVAVVAIRKCEEIREDEQLIGWLYSAIRIEGLKARRQQHRSALLLSDEVLQLIEQTRSQMPTASESMNMSALRECIGRLHGVTRRIIELRYGQNLKPAEIAQQTDKRVETVYKAITRAHSALRDCVQRRLTARGDAR